MKHIKRVICILLLVLLAIIATSCQKKKIEDNFSPVPLTKAFSPGSSQSSTAGLEIKGEPGKPQTVDIISGKPIVKDFYSDFNGERLYYCCDVEKKLIESSPQKYLQKIKEKGIILEPTPPQAASASPISPLAAAPPVEIKGEPGKLQTVDILSGKPIVKSVFSDFNGQRLYYCCDVEKKIVEEYPQLYLRKIKERGIILEATPKN
jgi:hypothetical protein